MRSTTRRPAVLSSSVATLAGAIASVLAAAPARAATDAESAGGGLQEIVVTAQKRSENLQTVPISVQAFDAKKLTELHVSDFASVAKYLPSLSFQTLGPSQAQIYFRGLTNGSDGLKTGTQPMVGVYLDEQPVTTIGAPASSAAAAPAFWAACCGAACAAACWPGSRRACGCARPGTPGCACRR